MNTGTYSVFASTFGLKIYYLIKNGKWLYYDGHSREATETQSIKDNLISNSDQLELQISLNNILIIK